MLLIFFIHHKSCMELKIIPDLYIIPEILEEARGKFHKNCFLFYNNKAIRMDIFKTSLFTKEKEEMTF